jgi:hypothetical protein
MPIEFRCTGCRAKLHVPGRWGGTTVPCPKCRTRVVVPRTPEDGPRTTFETRAVEESIAALEADRGGVFSDPAFRLPVPAAGNEAAETPEPVIAEFPGVTLPWWAVYAYVLLVPAVGIVSFLLGAWFFAPRAGAM